MVGSNQSDFPYAAVLAVWLGWTFIIVPRMVMSPLLPIIEGDFMISHETAGWLMSGYLLPYGFMQVLAGVLSDRFGRRNFIITAVFLSSLAGCLVFFAQSFAQLLILRILAGLSAGMFFAPSTAYISAHTHARERGKAFGIIFVGGSLANVLVNLSTALGAAEILPWRLIFVLFSLPGLVFAPFMISVLRESELGHATRQDRSFQLGALLGVLRMRSVVFLLLFALVSNVWWWSFTTFAVTYFVKGRGLDIPEASFLMTLFFALGVFRNPSAGFLADRFGYYKPAIFSIAVDTLATFLIPRVATGFPVMGLLVLWGVLGEMSWISFNVFIAEVVPLRVAGAFFGLYNALGFFTGTAGPVLFGRVADIAGFGPFFDLAFVIQALSLLLALGVRERRPTASGQTPLNV